MTEQRIASTKQAAAKCGFLSDSGAPNTRAFLQLRKEPGFPKPVMERGHHLWWDLKAIHQFFDKRNGLTVESEQAYYDNLAQMRIRNGSHQGEISRSQA